MQRAAAARPSRRHPHARAGGGGELLPLLVRHRLPARQPGRRRCWPRAMRGLTRPGPKIPSRRCDGARSGRCTATPACAWRNWPGRPRSGCLGWRRKRPGAGRSTSVARGASPGPSRCRLRAWRCCAPTDAPAACRPSRPCTRRCR